MDLQVDASSYKLNLRGNLRSKTKQTRKFPCKYTAQVAKKDISRQTHPIFHWLIQCVNGRHSTWLTWTRWSNGEKNLSRLPGTEFICTKLSASQHKCTQALAKRSRM